MTSKQEAGQKELRQERFEPVRVEWSRALKQKPNELAMRFALGAVIAVAAGVAGQVFGPRFGGLFLAFPAVLPAAITLVQRREGTDKAEVDALGAILGAVAMIPLALSVVVLIRPLGTVPALLIAGTAWVVFAVGLYFAARALLRRVPFWRY